MVPFHIKFGKNTNDLGVVDFKKSRSSKKQYMSLMVPSHDWQRYNMDLKENAPYYVDACASIILTYYWERGDLEEYWEQLKTHFKLNPSMWKGIVYEEERIFTRPDGSQVSSGGHFDFNANTTLEEADFFLKVIKGSLRIG